MTLLDGVIGFSIGTPAAKAKFALISPDFFSPGTPSSKKPAPSAAANASAPPSLAACCPLTNPNCDEPTNNLDLANIEFLENLVRKFRGALIVVSHDRRFLERCGVSAKFELPVAR